LLSACAAAPRGAAEQEIRTILDGRVTHTMDEARVRALIASDAEIIDEKGMLSRGPDALVPSFGPVPEIVKLEEQIDDVRMHPFGDAVVVTYRRQMHLVLGGAPVEKTWRVTETFVHARDGWKTAVYQETVTLGVPIAHAADEARLDDYVGRYELFPGYVYVVRREGPRLLFGATHEREFVPESPDAFVGAGDPMIEGFGYRLIFVREGGVVTRLRIVEFPGVEYEARRL
jgi:hypothetical protein